MMLRRRQRPRRLVRLSWGVGRFVALVAFTVAMTAAGIHQVNSQYQNIRIGYAIDQQLFEYRRQLEAQKRLSLSLAAYKDPTAVRAFAEDTLEMRVPGPADEFFIPSAEEGPPKPKLFGVMLPLDPAVP